MSKVYRCFEVTNRDIKEGMTVQIFKFNRSYIVPAIVVGDTNRPEDEEVLWEAMRVRLLPASEKILKKKGTVMIKKASINQSIRDVFLEESDSNTVTPDDAIIAFKWEARGRRILYCGDYPTKPKDDIESLQVSRFLIRGKRYASVKNEKGGVGTFKYHELVVMLPKNRSVWIVETNYNFVIEYIWCVHFDGKQLYLVGQLGKEESKFLKLLSFERKR